MTGEPKYWPPLPDCPLCSGTGDRNHRDLQVVRTRCPCTTDLLFFTKQAIRKIAASVVVPKS